MDVKKPGGSLPPLHKSAIGPYVVQDLFSLQHPQPTFLKSILILSSHLRFDIPKGLYPLGFLNNTYALLDSSMRATSPAHLSLST